jgi:hypothetical protein
MIPVSDSLNPAVGEVDGVVVIDGVGRGRLLQAGDILLFGPEIKPSAVQIRAPKLNLRQPMWP